MTKKDSKSNLEIVESVHDQIEKPSPPEDFMGQRIHELRTKKGLNHDGLARLTKMLDRHEEKGINRTTIRGYEVGMYKPGARELRLLSEALEVSPTWLLLGTDGNNPPLTPDMVESSKKKYREFEKLIRTAFLFPWIDKHSRSTIYDLIITMARMSLGEEKFRTEDLMLQELSSMLVDYFEDYKKDKKIPDMETLKPVMEKYMEMVTRKANMFFKED